MGCCWAAAGLLELAGCWSLTSRASWSAPHASRSWPAPARSDAGAPARTSTSAPSGPSPAISAAACVCACVPASCGCGWPCGCGYVCVGVGARACGRHPVPTSASAGQRPRGCGDGQAAKQQTDCTRRGSGADVKHGQPGRRRTVPLAVKLSLRGSAASRLRACAR